MLGSVFDMFTQINRTLDSAQRGLSLVKTLVGLHGGAVGVTSGGIDQGSSFTVILPTVPSLVKELQTLLAPPAEAAEVTEVTGAAEARPVCHRILVVDDNADAALTMVMLLGLSGHDARAAFGGQEALDVALAFRPHVVFLDIGMPDMSGYEVARHLLAAPATAISQTDCTDRLRCKAGHPEIDHGGLSCPPDQAG